MALEAVQRQNHTGSKKSMCPRLPKFLFHISSWHPPRCKTYAKTKAMFSHLAGQVFQRVRFDVTTDQTKLFGSCFLSVGKAFVNGYFLQRYESWAIEMFLAQGQTYL